MTKQNTYQETFSWSELTALPPAPGQARQSGLAGTFSGIHNHALIVAGGNNFPQAPPWQGGSKQWCDDIYVLEKNVNGDYQWHTNSSWRLPQPLSYGVSMATEEGLLCLGGGYQDVISDQVFLIQWNTQTKKVTIKQKPHLPLPLMLMAGARVHDTVYLAGGQSTKAPSTATSHFLSLNLSNFSYKALPSWPGPARIVPVAAAQSDGATDCFYLFSGRKVAPNAPTEILADAYCYHPVEKQWKQLADTQTSPYAPLSVMAGTALAVGDSHILVLGGDEGTWFLKLEALDRQIAQASDASVISQMKQQKKDMLTTHPGFSRNILAYNTSIDTWTLVGQLPADSSVTTHVILWNESMVIVGGETRPGVRSTQLWKTDGPLPRF